MATPEPIPAAEPLSTLSATPHEFVRALAAELAAGDVRLPSFPDVAARVQRVLEDERATPRQVATVLGADAAMASRVLRLANSATFNPAGKPVTDLQTAVSRLGLELVRCATVGYALKQMRLDDASGELRGQLQELWRKGTLVASIAYVLARETRAASPDEALVTGLLHNVGRLYLLLRAGSASMSLITTGAWDQVLHDLHPRIAGEILRHWRFPAPIVAAVSGQNHWDRPAGEGERLTDVLIAATSLVPCVFYRALLDDTVTSVAPFRRLQLTSADCNRLLGATARQIKALRDALVG